MVLVRAYRLSASTTILVDVSTRAWGSPVIDAQGGRLEAFLRGWKEGV